MSNEIMTYTAAKMMLEAMKKLSDKQLSPQEAQGIAVLGRGVIDAANAEINFIKTCKALPKGGLFSSDMVYLEPNVSRESLEEQELRLITKSRGRHGDG